MAGNAMRLRRVNHNLLKNTDVMKHASNQRRGRSRGNGKRTSSSRNSNFESHGPETKIRGSAQQIQEKYLTLARDAYSAGDRIAAEGYFQYAEHYHRISSADQNNGNGQQPRSGNANDKSGDGGNNNPNEKSEGGGQQASQDDGGKKSNSSKRRRSSPNRGSQDASGNGIADEKVEKATEASAVQAKGQVDEQVEEQPDTSNDDTGSQDQKAAS